MEQEKEERDIRNRFQLYRSYIRNQVDGELVFAEGSPSVKIINQD